MITTEQGLFSLIIGQGALLGGEVASLLDIQWGSNTYFLKIELDIENNGSYMDFGTQQFMSVPYALYAESSGTPGPQGPEGPQGEPADPVDYDSLVNELILDSAFIADFSGSSDCNYQFPEGFEGQSIIVDNIDSQNLFTVPDGKRLYILSFSIGQPIISGLNNPIWSPSHNPLILNSGQSISSSIIDGNDNDGNGFSSFNGLLINVNTAIEAISTDVSFESPYQVPFGKKLCLYNWYPNGPKFSEGSEEFSVQHPFPLVINAGTTLFSHYSADSPSTMNGYLVDEDYFANCGGGNNTLSSSIDYNALADALVQDSVFLSNLSGGISMGNDLLFPEGVDGEVVSETINHELSYVVPDGKRLYILNWKHSHPQIDELGNQIYFSNYKPIILNSGQSLTSYDSDFSFMNGILVNETDKLTAITIDISSDNNYTVPSGKNLYILNSNSQVIVNNNFEFEVSGNKPLIVKGNQVITPSGILTINGYLVDEDYFESPQVYVPDALQSTDDMFAAMQEQINALIVNGCTDINYVEYNSKANIDDGSCQTLLDIGVFYQGGYIFELNFRDDGIPYGKVANENDFFNNFNYNLLSISDLTDFGFSDWYHPNLSELETMIETIGSPTFDNIADFDYSSNSTYFIYMTLSGYNPQSVNFMDINTGQINSIEPDFYWHRSRPIRTF